MPVYAYRALNAQGKTVKGVIDADTPQKARQRLRAEGLHPTELNVTKSQSKTERSTRPKKMAAFRTNRLRLLTDTTRQMATLLAAGIPLVSALTTIQEQTDDGDFGHRLALIREEVTGGESLATALSKHTDIFPNEYIHMVRAGELGGALDPVLERLAGSLEKRQARRASITAALAYPAFMTLVGGGVLFFLLSFIVPTLTGLFDNLEAALPWPTRLLLAISGLFQNYWWAVVIVLVALVFVLKRLLKKQANYRRAEQMVFKVPVLGSLLQRLRLAQALRGMAVMTGGGVPLSTALNVTSQGLGNSVFGLALENTAQMVSQGRSLATGLENSRLFPPMAIRMVAVGEASGTLTEMLDRVAKTYEEETDRVLSTLTSLVEPIIILVMGAMVGFVVLAVLLPIFDLSGLVH